MHHPLVDTIPQSHITKKKELIKHVALQSQYMNQDEIEQHLTSAYEDFKDRLCYKYLISLDTTDFSQLQTRLNMIPGNSSPQELAVIRGLVCITTPLILPTLYWSSQTAFEVDVNHFALVIKQTGQGKKTEIYGPGVHILGMFCSLQEIYSFHKNLNQQIIESEIGDLKIVRVNQGTIMSFECSGQNIILPPGIHRITDPLIYQETISLDSSYIQIGPEKWITVPDGYDGISINRGQIKILQGGQQHHLKHVGEKFLKMIPKILQTDRVPTDISTYLMNLEKEEFQHQVQKLSNTNKYDPSQYLLTTTLEGATISLDIMIFWYIRDTELSAKSAMEIQNYDDNPALANKQMAAQYANHSILHLRQTVLRIVKKHICSLVSTCSISSKMKELHEQDDPNDNKQNTFEILTVLQHRDNELKKSINIDLKKIGCELDNICIYSVTPQNDIQIEIDKQTKAKVDAKTAIILAYNNQQTQLIQQDMQNQIQIKNSIAQSEVVKNKANAEAEAMLIKSQAQAKSIFQISDAREYEAKKIQNSQIAQELELMRVTGEAGHKMFTGGSNNFIFGANPKDAIQGLWRGPLSKK